MGAGGWVDRNPGAVSQLWNTANLHVFSSKALRQGEGLSSGSDATKLDFAALPVRVLIANGWGRLCVYVPRGFPEPLCCLLGQVRDRLSGTFLKKADFSQVCLVYLAEHLQPLGAVPPDATRGQHSMKKAVLPQRSCGEDRGSVTVSSEWWSLDSF